MCKKKPYCGSRIDECLREEIKEINSTGDLIKTIASCCGHGKYPKTIIIRHRGHYLEWYSRTPLKKPKLNRFYKKDKQGYYYLNPDLIIESEGIFPPGA